MRRYLYMIGLVALVPVNALAAAWTQDAGDWQLINNIFYYGTDSYRDASGQKSKQPFYNKIEYNPYLEYGLSDDVTLGLSPSFQYVRQDIPAVDADNIGLADTEFFVRKRIFWDGQNVLSIQPLVKIPGPYDNDDTPSLGQGQTDAELKLLYGHAFDDAHYLNLEAGYRYRFAAPGDELRFNAAYGYRPASDWLLLFEGQGIFAVEGAGGNTAFISNSADYDLVKLQMSAVYFLTEQTGLQIGAFNHVYARNTGEGGGVIVSLWHKFE